MLAQRYRDSLYSTPPRPAPEYVVDRLARFHPAVKLTWSIDRWVMVEMGWDGEWRHITSLRQHEEPTLENTVFALNDMSVTWSMTEREKEEWLAQLDEIERTDEERDADDRMQEGHERMHHLLMPSCRIIRP